MTTTYANLPHEMVVRNTNVYLVYGGSQFIVMGPKNLLVQKHMNYFVCTCVAQPLFRGVVANYFCFCFITVLICVYIVKTYAT